MQEISGKDRFTWEPFFKLWKTKRLRNNGPAFLGFVLAINIGSVVSPASSKIIRCFTPYTYSAGAGVVEINFDFHQGNIRVLKPSAQYVFCGTHLPKNIFPTHFLSYTLSAHTGMRLTYAKNYSKTKRDGTLRFYKNEMRKVNCNGHAVTRNLRAETASKSV